MALRAHRERLRARGLVRLELRVGRQDVPLLRQVAEALADPARADAARALLRARFAPPRPPSFKAYLETAPLDGVPIERDPDTGRDIAL
jgi:hypothetical protein